uniref:ORF31 n=1 Tax=Chlamydomonas reinhardtii TaxID=3055 RepID=Q99201_CHLRE|nr:unnamed protein product [Chlamydomonas reinhardtii]
TKGRLPRVTRVRKTALVLQLAPSPAWRMLASLSQLRVTTLLLFPRLFRAAYNVNTCYGMALGAGREYRGLQWFVPTRANTHCYLSWAHGRPQLPTSHTPEQGCMCFPVTPRRRLHGWRTRDNACVFLSWPLVHLIRL